jgi:hypothetical protein
VSTAQSTTEADVEIEKLWDLERIKRELQDCLLHERTTTGVDRRHWTDKQYVIGGNDE